MVEMSTFVIGAVGALAFAEPAAAGLEEFAGLEGVDAPEGFEAPPCEGLIVPGSELLPGIASFIARSAAGAESIGSPVP